jgi:hypothetical protein
MRAVAALALLLAACPSTALHSTQFPGLWLQREYTLNTKAPCLDAPELLRCAERMAALILDQAAAMGHARDRADAMRQWGKPGLCLIPAPEPCCVGDLCAGGKRDPRAGCTYVNSSWLSREWPAGTRYDWSPTLETELRTSIANRLGIPSTARHDSPWDLGPRTGVRCEVRP